MAAFATVDDLADYLGRDRFGDPTEYRQASLLLDLASAEIRAWTRQTIDLVSNDEVSLAGTWSPVLELPERPVVSVSSVELDGQAWVVDSDYSVAAGALLVSGTLPSFNGYPGATGRSGAHWGGPGVVVSVTYTHGFATVPGAVKAATLAIAGRMVNAGTGGVRQESIAGYSVTYANAGATTTLTDAEKASLRYLRRTWA
jgi:hypothetical protein